VTVAPSPKKLRHRLGPAAARHAREVVVDPGLLAVAATVGEDHDPPRHPLHLGQPGLHVGPVVDGLQRHRGIEAAVLEGQRFGARPHHRRRVGGTLGDHLRRRLDRRHPPLAGLIPAGARADVQHRHRISQPRLDRRLDPWVGTARPRIALPDPVIKRVRHRNHLSTSSECEKGISD
jgi:hypothetical protein